MVTLRSRINELEAENDRLSAGGGSAADASSAFGSPLKANRPAAEVVAAAAAAAARGGGGARGALGARLDASMPAAAAAALPPPPLPPPPPPAAPSGARRGLGGADIWAMGRQRVAAGGAAVNGGAVRVAAAHAAAAAEDPPGLREDFLVAAHRLRWAQRALDAAAVREAFGAWRRSVAQRTRQVRGAQLLLHRVLRRSKAQAFQAWRAAVMAPADDDDEDEHAGAAAAATSPDALRRLLKRAPAAVSRAFDAQAALFAAALAAAEEARGELAKAHAAELAALRQDIATQSSSLQRAMATASRLQPAAGASAETAWKPPLPPPAEAQRRRQGVPPLSLPLPPLVPRPVVPRPQPPPEPEAPPQRPQAPPPPPPQIRLPPMQPPPQAGFSRAAALLSHAAAPPPPSPPASEAPSSAPPSPLPAPRPTRPAPPQPPPLAFAPAALPSRPSSAAGSAATAPPSRQAASGPAVRDGAGLVQVATLVIRGWTRSDATEALNACGGRVDAAAAWLLARGRMPQAAEARQAGPGAVTPRTPTQQL